MKTVISCSRRTDIPAFYYNWLQERLKEGSVTLFNVYSQKNYTVDLRPENVHSIVFWSKNYANFIRDPGLLNNYNLYFQFTITGYGKSLEINVPDWRVTVSQLHKLAERYSPEQINWRFDPLVFRKNDVDCIKERLKMFNVLCREISSSGVERCTISFASYYKHVKQRLAKRGYNYIEPSVKFQREFTSKMVDIAGQYGITVYTCSSPLIENVNGIKKSHCIDGDVLSRLFGEKASKAKDTGQREACGCTKSKDIGMYNQVCKHCCLYCYQQVW